MTRKRIWIIEIIVWLFIIFGVLFCFIYKTAIKDNFQNTYYIFFNDVDGLVKGSPVRLMGINIGYVKDIKIFDNKVFVSILVTKDNVKIPKSATATIEFYGLGGSTSLELNPSTASETAHIEEIIPSESYRVQDFWDGQKLTANTMIDIYGGIGRTIEKADLMNNKQIFFQSKMVNELIQKTKKINKEQTVIINKLGEDSKEPENTEGNNN